MLTLGIHHIVLTVKDIQKSIDFYTNICGLQIISQEPSFVGLTDKTFTLWLSLPRDEVPLNQEFNRNNTGLDHWAFRVNTIDDLKTIEQKLKNLNAPMEDGKITSDGFGGVGIFTKDPDGMKVEFHLQQTSKT